MNKQQREQLNALYSEVESIKDKLKAVASDEREKYDNLNEGLQASERGQAMEAAADALDSAVSDLENVLGNIEEAMQ